MSFVDDLMIELNAARRQRDHLDVTIDKLAELVDHLNGHPITAPPEVEAPAEQPEPAPKRKKKPKKIDQVTCPDCGKTFKGAHGLQVHRSRAHKGSAAKPVKPAAPPVGPLKPSTTKPAGAPPSREPTVRGYVFRCECGDEEPNLNWLTIHTSGEHDRLPTNAERSPVKPALAAAS